MPSLEEATLAYIASASAHELWQQHYSDLSEDVMTAALISDPTSKLKDLQGYGPVSPKEFQEKWGTGARQWIDLEKSTFGVFTKQILTWYKGGSLNIRADGVVSQSGRAYLLFALVEYLDLKRYVKDAKQPNQFKTAGDFESYVWDELTSAAFAGKAEVAAKESEIFYEDEIWTIIIPKTWFASKFYGGESSWCTARKSDSNYFNQYSREGTLYMCMRNLDEYKSPEDGDALSDSVQVFIPTDPANEDYPPQFAAWDDTMLEWDDISEYRDLIKIFKSKGVDLANHFRRQREHRFVVQSNILGETISLNLYDHITSLGGEDRWEEIDRTRLILLPLSYKQLSVDTLRELAEGEGETVNWANQGLLIFTMHDGSLYDYLNNRVQDYVASMRIREGVDTFPDEQYVSKELSEVCRSFIQELERTPDCGYIVFSCAAKGAGPVDVGDFYASCFPRGFHALGVSTGPYLLLPNSKDPHHLTVMARSDQGGMADALLDPVFRARFTGEDATNPEQAARDRQQELGLLEP